jgi:hypothetical protein
MNKPLPTPPVKRHHLDSVAPDLIAKGSVGDPDELLCTKRLADWLDTSTQFLEIGRHCGYGPPFLRLSPRCIRYQRSQVITWLEERAHRHTAEYAAPKSEG